MSASKDISGLKFNKLLVVGDSGRRSTSGAILWECLCDCGSTTYQTSTILRGGTVKTCGCSKSDKELIAKKMVKVSKTKLGCRYSDDPFERTFRYKYHLDSTKSVVRSKDIKFLLSLEEYRSIVFLDCHYCGKNPSNKVHVKRTYGYVDILVSGIDRKDSNGDYVFDNCVPCCKECNIMKMDMGYAEFLDWVKSVCEHSEL